MYSWHHYYSDSNNSSSEVWYGDLGLVPKSGGTLREYGEIRVGVWFEFSFHLTNEVPFWCWYGLAPSPLPLPELPLLLNVHDNTYLVPGTWYELTGRSRPPAFISKAPSTGPTAAFMIYLFLLLLLLLLLLF